MRFRHEANGKIADADSTAGADSSFVFG